MGQRTTANHDSYDRFKILTHITQDGDPQPFLVALRKAVTETVWTEDIHT